MSPKILATALAIALGPVLLASGCGSSDAPKGAKKLSFTLTSSGCQPAGAAVPAGPVTFDAKNDGNGSVTELEILDGEKILGEVENVSAGLSKSFSLTLENGTYTIYCPGGDTERGALTVTGSAKPTGGGSDAAAVAQYRKYLERNVSELIAKTTPFVAAVKRGDIEGAKALYGPARVPYERVEPVAESFGDLDPRIDARANDVPPSLFGGFHRIEKALWEDDSTAGMAPIADKLLINCRELARKVKNVKLTAPQIANGANSLLGEVSASKITGEEERYSHLDLVDFEANVEGAQVAFDSVKPIVVGRDPQLVKEIDGRFDAVYGALKPYRRGSSFVLYTELSKADTRKLARSIDALAEPLSQVAGQTVQ